MGSVERPRNRRSMVHALPYVDARAASSHCRSRLAWDPAIIIGAARLGAISLRDPAVPRLAGRARRERLALCHSGGPEHLGCRIRTSDAGDLVSRIRFSCTDHTGLCWFQLLDVSRKAWRFLNSNQTSAYPRKIAMTR